MYFKIENTKKIAINKNEEYVQFSATANWEDSFGDFGILDCIGNMVVIKDILAVLYMVCVMEETKIKIHLYSNLREVQMI
tara:strand:+ start:1041 stop:1280 length:240 start_codon:yes stop_codon:yes gene_type:complete